MDDKKLNRIWDEIIEQSRESYLGRLEGEITRQEFCVMVREKYGIVLSDWQSKNTLRQLVMLNVLSVRPSVWVPELNKKVNLYSPVIK